MRGSGKAAEGDRHKGMVVVRGQEAMAICNLFLMQPSSISSCSSIQFFHLNFRIDAGIKMECVQIVSIFQCDLVNL